MPSTAAPPGPVAVVGLGRMGRAMAERLRGAGLEVVVWNRTRSVADELAARTGARAVATPREAAAAGAVTIQSLADDAALRAVTAGPDGVVAGLGRDSILVETSTVDPATVLDLVPEVAARGAVVLDAPVSGSVPAVLAGTLLFMVGGDESALDRARPVLAHLGDRILHLGPSGAGAAMKLAVNGVVHALNIALSEALVMAEGSAVDRRTAWEVLGASVVGAPFVAYKREAFLAPESTPTAFSLDLVAKDLRLILALAERSGVAATQVRTNLGIARDAVAAGFGDRDMSWIAQALRDSAGSGSDGGTAAT